MNDERDEALACPHCTQPTEVEGFCHCRHPLCWRDHWTEHVGRHEDTGALA